MDKNEFDQYLQYLAMDSFNRDNTICCNSINTDDKYIKYANINNYVSTADNINDRLKEMEAAIQKLNVAINGVSIKNCKEHLKNTFKYKRSDYATLN